MKKLIAPIYLLLLLFTNLEVHAQHAFAFKGEASAYGSYSPDNDLDLFFGGRYLPEINCGYAFENKSLLDFELSANINGSLLFRPFDRAETDGAIKAYRVWMRYSGQQYEVRIGLQKINFGTAMLLRPLQWFDEMDARDPLKFTTGVYGALARYYFLNNANVWVWGLYGNENPRGFESLKNNEEKPEFGGRLQLPVPKGEVAITYHHRSASSENVVGMPLFEKIPENRYALDGKWDVGVGAWFEAVHINKAEDVGMLRNQSFLTLGMDYTFAIGNGLNVTLENMTSTYDQKSFAFEHNSTITATSISYPLGLFNTLSTLLYYSWKSEDFSLFVNYEHQFQKLTGYIMGYYNPKSQQSMGSISYENSFSGPGIRLMLVYNH
ncbi:MAG TPA: hypothetical protein VKY45_09510 [Marinilabiliaceae bacterium]|nr:hypothetical protein [Marinilabiliaceae bacterium]